MQVRQFAAAVAASIFLFSSIATAGNSGGGNRAYGGSGYGFGGDARAYGGDARAYGGDARAYGTGVGIGGSQRQGQSQAMRSSQVTQVGTSQSTRQTATSSSQGGGSGPISIDNSSGDYYAPPSMTAVPSNTTAPCEAPVTGGLSLLWGGVSGSTTRERDLCWALVAAQHGLAAAKATGNRTLQVQSTVMFMEVMDEASNRLAEDRTPRPSTSGQRSTSHASVVSTRPDEEVGGFGF